MPNQNPLTKVFSGLLEYANTFQSQDIAELSKDNDVRRVIEHIFNTLERIESDHFDQAAREIERAHHILAEYEYPIPDFV